jgi:hypothetical protein
MGARHRPGSAVIRWISVMGCLPAGSIITVLRSVDILGGPVEWPFGGQTGFAALSECAASYLACGRSLALLPCENG